MATEWLKNYPEGGTVQKAYAFATEAHKDTKRENGDPYITHCLKVAETVHDWKLDEPSLVAALLHDVVEDTSYTVKDIEKDFGEEVAFLVNGLTKLDTIQYPAKRAEIENLRKLIISFSEDLRVLLVKLADRLHNMQTIRFLPEERQKRLAWETMEIYAPLAYRLGMQKLSGELEDLAFPYTDPEAFKWLLNAVKESYEERLNYGLEIQPIVMRVLEEHKIHSLTVDARAKRYTSLYKKLLRHNMNLEEIYDLVALRIILKSVEDCYAALGIIHQLWTPLPNRIKDYIARPKPNGYRSLHTTVFCINNKITEFQIRTQGMHEEDELGIAAHWAYQQIKTKEHPEQWKGLRERKELLWVEQLRNWQSQLTNTKEFVQSLKGDFFKDRIFVVTPENDVIDLPSGATPVDFAYHIHSDLGDQCVGAKVNGKVAQLDYELRSGDIIEIVTQRGKKPSENWLRFAKTTLARKHIKSALRQKQRVKPAEVTSDSHLEFKIVSQDRQGFLKETTAVFAALKINILYLNSETDHRKAFSVVHVKCDILPKTKLERLLLRLKQISGTKEVSYKVNR